MTDFNAADRKSIRAAEKAAKLVDDNNRTVITAVMNTAPGRRYLWDKLAAAHVFATTFSTDPVQMAFNEGQRNQGLLLLNDIMEWCPDQFILAMREFNGRRTSSELQHSHAGTSRRRGTRRGRSVDEPDAGSEAGDDVRRRSQTSTEAKPEAKAEARRSAETKPEAGKVPEATPSKPPKATRSTRRSSKKSPRSSKNSASTTHQAQRLADVWNKHSIDAAKAVEDAVTAQRTSWRDEITKDPALGDGKEASRPT